MSEDGHSEYAYRLGCEDGALEVLNHIESWAALENNENRGLDLLDLLAKLRRQYG